MKSITLGCGFVKDFQNVDMQLLKNSLFLELAMAIAKWHNILRIVIIIV